jgi:hypothetical protein
MKNAPAAETCFPAPGIGIGVSLFCHSTSLFPVVGVTEPKGGGSVGIA